MSQNDFSTSFTEYLKKYIQSNQQTDEFELRFGTNYSNKITRIDFDNVIKKLKLNNFTCESPNGQYHLNIQNEITYNKNFNWIKNWSSNHFKHKIIDYLGVLVLLFFFNFYIEF